jgi:hypothetical protein
MSVLLTLNRSCPFFTSSPSRASISTTRPDASDGAGTCRDTSGLTTPVTFNSGEARYSPAVANGNRSGWATLKLPASMSGSTAAGRGPVSASCADAAVTCFPHAAVKRTAHTHRLASRRNERFIESPPGPPPCSFGRERAAFPRPVVGDVFIRNAGGRHRAEHESPISVLIAVCLRDATHLLFNAIRLSTIV